MLSRVAVIREWGDGHVRESDVLRVGSWGVKYSMVLGLGQGVGWSVVQKSPFQGGHPLPGGIGTEAVVGITL